MNIRPAALLFSVVVILVGGIYFYTSTSNNEKSVNTELPVPVEDKITETAAEENFLEIVAAASSGCGSLFPCDGGKRIRGHQTARIQATGLHSPERC